MNLTWMDGYETLGTPIEILLARVSFDHAFNERLNFQAFGSVILLLAPIDIYEFRALVKSSNDVFDGRTGVAGLTLLIKLTFSLNATYSESA